MARKAGHRWDEAVGLSLDVVAYAGPQEHPAVEAVAPSLGLLNVT
jgi:hypothetical protein